MLTNEFLDYFICKLNYLECCRGWFVTLQQ